MYIGVKDLHSSWILLCWASLWSKWYILRWLPQARNMDFLHSHSTKHSCKSTPTNSWVGGDSSCFTDQLQTQKQHRSQGWWGCGRMGGGRVCTCHSVCLSSKVRGQRQGTICKRTICTQLESRHNIHESFEPSWNSWKTVHRSKKEFLVIKLTL